MRLVFVSRTEAAERLSVSRAAEMVIALQAPLTATASSQRAGLFVLPRG